MAISYLPEIIGNAVQWDNIEGICLKRLGNGESENNLNSKRCHEQDNSYTAKDHKDQRSWNSPWNGM